MIPHCKTIQCITIDSVESECPPVTHHKKLEGFKAFVEANKHEISYSATKTIDSQEATFYLFLSMKLHAKCSCCRCQPALSLQKCNNLKDNVLQRPRQTGAWYRVSGAKSIVLLTFLFCTLNKMTGGKKCRSINISKFDWVIRITCLSCLILSGFF